MMLRFILKFAALVGLALFAHGARAADMPGASAQDPYSLSGDLPGSQLVLGSSATVTTIQLNTAGTLSFTLTDKNFSSALGALSFFVTTADSTMGAMAGSGTFSMDVAGPMTLYADVFATAQGIANAGLYNLQVSFAPAVPVPLPTSGLLLAAALVAWQLRLRPFRPLRHNCHTVVA